MRVKRAVGDAVARVQGGLWGASQCGLAAAGGWAFATQVLGHPRPFFASTAAVITLGLTAGGRLRRTAELAAGVSLGVGIGDLWVALFGQGTLQIGLVVFLALLAALVINGGGLAVSQAAVQSVFVVALPRTPHSGLHRWQDALVGSAVSLLVAAFLPADPWKPAKKLRCSYLGDLAAVVRETADAVRTGSSTAAAEALGRGRMLDPLLAQWGNALSVGREVTKVAPLRATRRADWDRLMALHTGLTRATRNLRVLIRRVTVALEAGDPLPRSLTGLLDELAAALDLAARDQDAVTPLLALGAELDPLELGAMSLSSQVVVAQLRVALVDLLEGLGLDHDRARDALPALQP